MTALDRRRPPTRSARRRPQRSRSAVGAAVVAAAAMTTAFTFILTNGSPDEPTDTARAAPSAALRDGAPSAASSAAPSKPNRKPTVASRAAPAPVTSRSIDTGRASPKFRPGQWIAVLDTYELGGGLEAESLARGKAAKLLEAGIPAKAMVAKGQYPGLANSNLEPFTAVWVVYLGPAKSSAQVLATCSSPKVQQEAGRPACPTYEPAVSLGS